MHLWGTNLSELIVPVSGEVVSYDDPAGCLRVLTEIRELEARLKEVKADLTSALAAEFSRQGTKTLELDGIRAELRGGTDIVWDIEVLEELRELGLPEERMNALITTEIRFRVNANEAKRVAAANPAYAEVVERAKKVIPKATYVAVKPRESDSGAFDPRSGTSGHMSGHDPASQAPA